MHPAGQTDGGTSGAGTAGGSSGAASGGSGGSGAAQVGGAFIRQGTQVVTNVEQGMAAQDASQIQQQDLRSGQGYLSEMGQENADLQGQLQSQRMQETSAAQANMQKWLYIVGGVVTVGTIGAIVYAVTRPRAKSKKK